MSDPEIGVGPHPQPWPTGDHYDPDLLRDGDRRNVVDRYRYWTREAIVADLHWVPILSTLVYSVIGIVVFLVAYFVMEKLTPFSIRKEIEEEQNVALGIIIGACFIALAIIIAAAIR